MSIKIFNLYNLHWFQEPRFIGQQAYRRHSYKKKNYAKYDII